MFFTVIPTPVFIKDIEYYKKKKKYRKIEDDVSEIVSELESGNLIGDEITGLRLPDNQSSYKVRAANSDSKVGKSNGYRIIYYVIRDDQEIFLLTIYSKKDKEDIPKEEITDIINAYCT
ncbi:type II toxin-antitoxin system RelE/ParE family toxin [Paenibacillus jiagnxiensis]|uniref:type II toxin-antitoxin system RelE/ParE family toxin n=1 Tax=Paenibacillus jiagnxiensis TaxID=3228926 RepID=UPI0033B17C5C